MLHIHITLTYTTCIWINEALSKALGQKIITDWVKLGIITGLSRQTMFQVKMQRIWKLQQKASNLSNVRSPIFAVLWWNKVQMKQRRGTFSKIKWSLKATSVDL